MALSLMGYTFSTMPTLDPIKKRAQQRLWRERNRDKLRAAYLARDREAENERLRRWRAAHPESVLRYRAKGRAKFRAYRRAHRKLPHVKLATALYKRLHQVLGLSGGSGRMLRLLGCTVEQLMVHLEILFEPGMTWENRGSVWHVDHALPLSSFDLADPTQAARACHFTNLQPLFARDNLSKGAKVPCG